VDHFWVKIIPPMGLSGFKHPTELLLSISNHPLDCWQGNVGITIINGTLTANI